MAIQTIYPNEDIINEWTTKSAAEAWEEIDEVGTHDGLGTFISSKAPDQTFRIGFTTPSALGVINSITINFVINAVNFDSEFEGRCETANGVFTIDSAISLPQDMNFYTYSYMYTEDPNNTGVPFSYSDITDILIYGTAGGNDGSMVMTQIYITIDYTETTPKTVAMIIG